jgi:hypothetical protein
MQQSDAEAFDLFDASLDLSHGRHLPQNTRGDWMVACCSPRQSPRIP